MESHDVLSCANCGLEWRPEAPARSDATVACPVCSFPYLSHPAAAPAVASIGDLEAAIGALVSDARAVGLDADAIVAVLRNELEFSAELAHAGRRFFVQLLDLGPQEHEALYQPARSRSSALRSRSVGGR
jgi:hypothetical protein